MSIFHICTLLLFVMPCMAQETSKVSCRFLALEGGAAPPALLNIGPEGTEIRCEVPANSLSPATYCSAQDGIVRFISAEDRKPVASGKIPAGLKRAILLFVATHGAETPEWKIFVIPDSPKSFPEGGAYVANFYNRNVRFSIGEKNLMLGPGGQHGLAPPEQRDSFNMAPVMFQFQKDEKWITANESMLRFTPGIRYLIFTYVEPSSGRPHVATYQDFKRAEPVSAP